MNYIFSKLLNFSNYLVEFEIFVHIKWKSKFNLLKALWALKGEIHVKFWKNPQARQEKLIEKNEFYEATEGQLYGAGIAN